MPAMNGGAGPFISGYQSQELSARYVEVIGIYPFIIKPRGCDESRHIEAMRLLDGAGYYTRSLCACVLD